MLTYSWYQWDQLAQLSSLQPDEPRPESGNAERRRRFAVDTPAARVVIASVATLGVVIAVLLTSRAEDTSAVAPDPAPPMAEAQPPPASAPAGKPAPPAAPAGPAIDDRGFVNSKARCEGASTALAIGRTQRSLVVICKLNGGGYEYNGVRSSDGVSLRLGSVRATADGYIADNDGATYDVSPRELLVRSGDAILNREPWLEYRAPSAKR